MSGTKRTIHLTGASPTRLAETSHCILLNRNTICSHQCLETSPKLPREGTKLLRRDLCRWGTDRTNRVPDRD
ncbi:hypothetical protein PILCRDRAFT_827850 [Piloderma croceum F 1598]|uniref:Uncharacterized protein n=1 Tax=Piloderma croceum (strain F 1598) TaxID=765440 RepID=A0A0C3F429_PILCF|nr:hypothetical protein PILCRDRAFT_827850 [Piloderma croceum F 1598]